jgi:hypothetical protein
MNTESETYLVFNRMVYRMIKMKISIKSIYYTIMGDYMHKGALKYIINDNRLNDENRELLIVLFVEYYEENRHAL